MSPRLAASVLAVSALLAGCSGGVTAVDANGHPLTTGTTATSPTATVIPVVAAENTWGDIAAQIGGAHVHVTSIISDPNADPHTYETDPRDAAAVSAARLVIVNGVGYDAFADKLLDASADDRRTVINVQQLNAVTGSNPNPHLWYSPAYVAKTASAIAAALSTTDPADAAGFRRDEAAFLKAYAPYPQELAQIKRDYAGTRVSYTERVAGYLLDAAGLVLGTPAGFSQSVEDGNDPSPGDTAVFDADLKAKKVRVLLYNAQVADEETSAVKALATTSGIPVVGVTETLPAGENFQTWQLRQATAIFLALAR